MAEKDQNQADTEPAAQAGKQETRFGVQRIYVKDVSFEAPGSPESFRRTYNPQVNFSINTRTRKLEDSMYEVILRLTADVKQDDKTVFLVEVQQAGVFEILGLEDERLEQILSITCPGILFPYGREAIDGLATKGGFPPLMLAPVNFEAVYAQAKKNQQDKGGDQTAQPQG